MNIDNVVIMRKEYEAWLEVLALLKLTGAVTEEDCHSTKTDAPMTNGLKLFVAINEWGAWRHRQGVEKALEAEGK